MFQPDAEGMNNVSDNIIFTDDNQINRAYPVLLADNAKMSLMVWNKFCDAIDEAVKPLGHVSVVSGLLWFAVVVFVILNVFGWKIGTHDVSVYYGIIAPVMVVLFVLVCNLEDHVNKKVSSKIKKECAKAANHDKDLTMELVGKTPDEWYIEVTIRLALGVGDIESGEPIAVAEAIPVAVTSGASTVPAGPPPKKYTKDETTGKMTLNPAYKAWKSSQ